MHLYDISIDENGNYIFKNISGYLRYLGHLDISNKICEYNSINNRYKYNVTDTNKNITNLLGKYLPKILNLDELRFKS